MGNTGAGYPPAVHSSSSPAGQQAGYTQGEESDYKTYLAAQQAAQGQYSGGANFYGSASTAATSSATSSQGQPAGSVSKNAPSYSPTSTTPSNEPKYGGHRGADSSFSSYMNQPGAAFSPHTSHTGFIQQQQQQQPHLMQQGISQTGVYHSQPLTNNSTGQGGAGQQQRSHYQTGLS